MINYRHIATLLIIIYSCTSHAQSQHSVSDITTSYAQPKDNVTADFVQPKDSTEVDKGFNALNYSLQKRYQNPHEAFSNEKWRDNTYMSFSVGTEQILKKQNSSYSWGEKARFGYGKMLNRTNRIELGASLYTFIKNADGIRLWSPGVDFRHSFSFSSYIGGYKTARIFDISSVEAIGFNHSFTTSNIGDDSPKNGSALSLLLGMEFSARLNKYISLSFVPYVQAYSDGIDLANNWNWHKYDFSYGAYGSIKWHFGYKPNASNNLNSNNSLQDNKKINDNVNSDIGRKSYIFLNGGGQVQCSQLVKDNVGIAESIRESLNIGYGYKLTQSFDINASIFYGVDCWKKYTNLSKKYCYYGGVRVEAVWDWMYLLPKYKEDNNISHNKKGQKTYRKTLFSIPVLVGPEFGILSKRDDLLSINKVYIGISAATQLRLRLGEKVAIYLEPRFSIVPYTYRLNSENTLLGKSYNYFDNIFRLSFGFAYYL